ncbi:hypothetical protein BIV57_14120, partial [Mangrovactinospora gilvigrisea]
MPQSRITRPRPEDEHSPAFIAGELYVSASGGDGFAVEPCPERRVPVVERRAAAPATPLRPSDIRHHPVSALVGRAQERAGLVELLSQGRSVLLTGPSGVGRSALLAAVAADCAHLAPDGVVRLDGTGRTADDLLHELFAATHRVAGAAYRPDGATLRARLASVGAVVTVDDLEFGGEELERLVSAAPECAFLLALDRALLIGAGRTAGLAHDSRLEEVALEGLERNDAFALLERRLGRPLMGPERGWAGDLWFESQGLPLRFVQAAAVLRQRDARGRGPGAAGEWELPPMAQSAAPAALLAADLSAGARELLRIAIALDGQLPAAVHLPALTGAVEGADAVTELLDAGLATAAGSGESHRLAAHVLPVPDQLDLGSPFGPVPERPAGVVDALVDHYVWFAGHTGVTPAAIAAEAEAVLGAMAAARDLDRHDAVVRLARAAGPVFAAALRWGAWERALRLGAEAARRVGEPSAEAYFHHELAVHALVTEDRATAREEAASAVERRAALGEQTAAALSRRVLAACGAAEPVPAELAGLGELGDGASASASASPAVPATAELPALVAAGAGGGVGGVRRPVDRRRAMARRRMAAVAASVVVVLGASTVLSLQLGKGRSDGAPDKVRPTSSAVVTTPTDAG